MNTLVYCAFGALLCVGWFFVQMKIFDWADNKGTTLAWLLSRASLLLLSTAITAVSFTAFITLYMMFVMSAFGS
jgi:hypothetical protein